MGYHLVKSILYFCNKEEFMLVSQILYTLNLPNDGLPPQHLMSLAIFHSGSWKLACPGTAMPFLLVLIYYTSFIIKCSFIRS